MMPFSMDMQQESAAKTQSEKTLVVAGAGSGKTRTLVERIAYLINDCKVSSYEIVAFSFTRKASMELTERLRNRIGNKAKHVLCGTMHAVALQMVTRFGEVLGLRPSSVTVYGAWEEEFLLKEVAKDLGIWKGSWKVPKRDVDRAFSDYYERGLLPEKNDKAKPLFDAFMARCRENNSLTYGGLLMALEQLLPIMSKHLHFRHVLVDETQDIDPLQWRIINGLCEAFGASLFVVGDVRQCQPAGTRVLLSDGTEIDIAELDPKKHQLRAYSKHDALIYGGRNKGFSFSKSSRLYSGLLHSVRAGDFLTHCTSNHKWYVKWRDRSRSKNVVYLMRSGDRFRVGWCQLFTNKGTSHLSQRARIERADDVWILDVFDSKSGASLYEQIVAARYGLPTIMFHSTKTTPLYGQEGIDSVFQAIGDLTPNAIRCLDDHGRHIDHPFWSQKNVAAKMGATTVFGISTYNFINNLFMLPVRNGERNIEWVDAEITANEVKDIEVFSLDVEKHHTYVANGICTRNSIYSFRGAVPEYLLEHQSEFDIYELQNNYRSVPSIVHASNRLMTHSVGLMGGGMVATRQDGVGRVMVEHNLDSAAIAEVQSHVLDLPDSQPAGDYAILARNHKLLQRLDEELTQRGVPHTYIGRKTSLIESEPFRKFHAFLKLTVNPYDNFEFLLIRDVLGMNAKDYAQVRYYAASKGMSHHQAWLFLQDGGDIFRSFFATEYETFYETLMSLHDLLKFDDWSEAPFSFAYSWAFQNQEASTTEYLSWLATYDSQDEYEDAQGVTLATIHAAKGLEWPVVIVAGCNEGILPSKRSLGEGGLEEERRLMYVAMTRARDQLILAVRPEVSEKNGKVYESPVSRFVSEALG